MLQLSLGPTIDAKVTILTSVTSNNRTYMPAVKEDSYFADGWLIFIPALQVIEFGRETLELFFISKLREYNFFFLQMKRQLPIRKHPSSKKRFLEKSDTFPSFAVVKGHISKNPLLNITYESLTATREEVCGFSSSVGDKAVVFQFSSIRHMILRRLSVHAGEYSQRLGKPFTNFPSSTVQSDLVNFRNDTSKPTILLIYITLLPLPRNHFTTLIYPDQLR